MNFNNTRSLERMTDNVKVCFFCRCLLTSSLNNLNIERLCSLYIRISCIFNVLASVIGNADVVLMMLAGWAGWLAGLAG